MVSQALESGILRVNKSKLEVEVGAAGPGARHIHAETARGACQFTFRGETIRATAVVKYLGLPAGISGKHARSGTNADIQGLQGPGSVFSRFVGPSLHRLEHQNQTLAETASPRLAARGRSSCMATARCGNSGQVAKTAHYGTLEELLFVCLGSARKNFQVAWSAHRHVYAASSEVALS